MNNENERETSENNYIDDRIVDFCDNAENDYLKRKSVTVKPKIPFQESFNYNNNKQMFLNQSQNDFNGNNLNYNSIQSINKSIKMENNYNNVKIIDERKTFNNYYLLPNQIEQKTIKVIGPINNPIPNYIDLDNGYMINNKKPKIQNNRKNKDNPNFQKNNIQNTNFQSTNLKSNNHRSQDNLNSNYLNSISQYNIDPNNNPVNRYNIIKYTPIINQNNKKKILPPYYKPKLTSKSNIDINKILLNAKTFIKKYQFKQAHNILKSLIDIGVYHSDLFYLYGEVNRILKNLQEAEDYLLLAINFELHSPYAFYSLGLLYQEVSEYKYSNIFFKLFRQLIKNPDVHFQMGKNYFEMRDYNKAIEQLSKAIKLNNECADYYKLRGELYNLIGMIEKGEEDEKMFYILLNTKNPDES